MHEILCTVLVCVFDCECNIMVAFFLTEVVPACRLSRLMVKKVMSGFVCVA